MVFLVPFFAQTFSKAFILVDYLANNKAYIQNCENKAKPAMHCNGKCQMAKKMKNEEKKEERLPDRKGDTKDVVLSSKSFFCTVAALMADNHKTRPLYNKVSLPVDRAYGIFHPPQA